MLLTVGQVPTQALLDTISSWHEAEDAYRLQAEIIRTFVRSTCADYGLLILFNDSYDVASALCADYPADEGNLLPMGPDQVRTMISSEAMDAILNQGGMCLTDMDRMPADAKPCLCKDKRLNSMRAEVLEVRNRLMGIVVLGAKDDPDLFSGHGQTLQTLALFAAQALLGMHRREQSERAAAEATATVHRLEALSRDMASEHENLQDSVRYASRIQQTLLQDPAGLGAYFSDHFVLYKPKDLLSGDFYWWAKQGQTLLIAMADCTGHGVPGAMLSFMGINLLNQLALESPNADPARLLSLLNFRMVCNLQPDDAPFKILDGMEIGLLTLDLQTKKLQYAGANRPLFICRNGELVEFKGNSFPIAGNSLGLEDELLCRVYDNVTYDLKPGNRVFLFSDGMHDVFGERDGRSRKLGKRAFLDQLQSLNRQMPLGKIGGGMETFLAEWRGDQAQVDDMLMIGLEVSG